MPPDIAVLVSIGRHPVSRRPRRADFDARALELALSCGPAGALHAGPAGPSVTFLRDYLGMGAASLTILEICQNDDPLPALAANLRAMKPRLILTGARAEAGECSGMVPFRLAEDLGYAMATRIVEIALGPTAATLVQALPGGRRRRLAAALPLLVTVDGTGPEPRLSAYGRARRGAVQIGPGGVLERDARLDWATRPSRPRPKRLAAPNAAGAAAADGHRQLVDSNPDAAAGAILDVLEREGLLAPASSVSPPSHPVSETTGDPQPART